MLLGIDTGGTFTDFVHYHPIQGLRFHKVLSTPDDPSRAIMQGVRELGLEPATMQVIHGSTVATNAILERKGVKTLLVTQQGMEDVLHIGRQQREHLYRLDVPAREAFPGIAHCFGIGGRVYADGSCEAVPTADLDRLRSLAGDYDAVAVCTLFSFLDPSQELAVDRALADHPFVTLSHQLVAESGEYERASTVFLNAFVGPLVKGYLRRLERQMQPERLLIMHSAGGLMTAGEAAERAAHMVLSGPAGGCVAAQHVAQALHTPRLLTLDMGGTSTDVALIDGEVKRTVEARIDHLPVALPTLAIHTIGAGGGSMAWLDAAGLLQIGPQSAGSSPGPVCYGKGGTVPTVTDAHVFLGRIPADTLLAGSLPLDMAACRHQMQQLAARAGLDADELAQGMLAVAEAHMVGALRRVSVDHGVDVRDFALFCFGGAGALHACSLAEQLGMSRVIIPAASGAFSAFGMLAGQRRSDVSRSCLLPLDQAESWQKLQGMVRELRHQLEARMQGLQPDFSYSLDMRYRGQGTALNLPLTGDAAAMVRRFEALHQQRYGHVLDLSPDVVTVRVAATMPAATVHFPSLEKAAASPVPMGESEVVGTGCVPHYRRAELRAGHQLCGPALVREPTSTIWLAAGWQLQVADAGHLLLSRVES